MQLIAYNLYPYLFAFNCILNCQAPYKIWPGQQFGGAIFSSSNTVSK
jgi:hypothetical protein